ncbi:putative HNH homing endonuclease [uncultured phage cr116_1]|uniref:Putative HNH homing endonuclease n=1 Tax=uncultured phage cr116_1 TaxID=2772073 RepID=A0A7M1RZP1_9CAUD|nr:HNH endonuclease [uncultured phage cr116_1]QOR59371.1 putative HNH homing endonuclease [uncultured phage cr116_1]DAK53068.1 MAG TPA: homing endonuclease [Crassvirales sp.]
MERKSLRDISWQVIPGLENYAASDTGDIKALPKIREGNLSCLNNMHDRTDKSHRHYKEKILKQTFKQRYFYVSLTQNGVKKNYRVHRLVYMAFKGLIPEGMVIDHIDGNTKNNNISNLRCASISENCQNPNTICKKYKAVVQIDKSTNEVLHIHSSIKDAMLSLGFNYSPSMTCHIGDVCNNKRNTCYGYKWKWKKESI